MAEKTPTVPTPPPSFSDADKSRARQWFKKAGDCRERREYDYAIECFITGLGSWLEAVEEGHMPLRSLAIQRQQAGGKKPSFMENLKKPVSGKDFRQAMLNAEHLFAMDPQNLALAEALFKNATKAGLLETCKWIAPTVLDLLRREKKIDRKKFGLFRDTCVEAAALASEHNVSGMETFLLEQAVQSLDFMAARMPGDDIVRNDLRDLAGRLTIARGKYEQADSFRESIRDAESQKLLHDAERMRQGSETLESLIAAAKKEWEAAPTVAAKLNAYIDALLKADRDVEDQTAIEVLLNVYGTAKNYSLKAKADDIRLRVLKRTVDALIERARTSGSADDKQQARLAQSEMREESLKIFRERVEQYPTDLRLKYLLGRALFESGEFDEAIPVLQIAQQDPRTRVRCQLMLGRSFFERSNFTQAVAILSDALDKYELVDDASKSLLYWLGRSAEAAGIVERARDAYGRLLRQDYNYMDGDARKRLDALGH